MRLIRTMREFLTAAQGNNLPAEMSLHLKEGHTATNHLLDQIIAAEKQRLKTGQPYSDLKNKFLTSLGQLAFAEMISPEPHIGGTHAIIERLSYIASRNRKDNGDNHTELLIRAKDTLKSVIDVTLPDPETLLYPRKQNLVETIWAFSNASPNRETLATPSHAIVFRPTKTGNTSDWAPLV